MRHRRLTTLGALLVALMLAGIAPLTTSAATGTRFGAKLTKKTQPDARVEWCRDSNHSSTCTWVAVEAFENGDKEKAPQERHHPQGPAHLVRRGQLHGPGGTGQARRGQGEDRPLRADHQLRQGHPVGRLWWRRRRQLQDPELQRELPRERGRLHRGARAPRSASSTTPAAVMPLKFRPPLPVGGSYEVADDARRAPCSSSSSTHPSHRARAAAQPRLVAPGRAIIPGPC